MSWGGVPVDDQLLAPQEHLELSAGKHPPELAQPFPRAFTQEWTVASYAAPCQGAAGGESWIILQVRFDRWRMQMDAT